MTEQESDVKMTIDILNIIEGGEAEIDGDLVEGMAIYWVREMLKEKGWRRLGNIGDFESSVENCGFGVVQGYTLCGTAKGGGVKRNKARVVYLSK